MARALIIVDVQRDFCPGGALGVPDGDAVVPRANALARSDEIDLVVATRDWHPPDHGSFVTAEPPGPWPVHCVQGTAGAELHPDLDRAATDVVLDKGTAVDTEGYSGFDATDLADLLRARGVEELLVVGLATDYCVRATALEARQHGFAVTVDPSAVRAVEVEPGDGRRALEELRAAGVRLATPRAS